MGRAAVTVPLLRAPPFPHRKVEIARHGKQGAALSADILATLADARVGGNFWAEPAVSCDGPRVVLRPRQKDDLAALADSTAAQPCLWIGAWRAVRNFAQKHGGQWQGEVDPWSALDGAEQLVAHGEDEWVAIARICGVPVRLLSSGCYGSPGDSEAALDDRVTTALGSSEYIDPFTGATTTPEATIALLQDWRRLIDANRSIAVTSGIAWWKRQEIRRFLWVPGRRLRIVSSAAKALAHAARCKGSIAIWPSRASPWLLSEAHRRGVELVRIEDGFVRSVGLGSNLVPPSSIVVDRRGIHFDPVAPSDLEHFLATAEFSEALQQRARVLRNRMVSAGIGKYGTGAGVSLPPRQPGRRLVLVPAQVEDDMSVLAGGGGLSSNLELLRRVRALEPDADIWFRPHPDVEAGHRTGAVPRDKVLQYADRIVSGGSMAALLDSVDAVHVLTSLTGFEALLRRREVICHGTPFYAGWGLTRDLGDIPTRRGRKLELDQLVAGVLILYPRYLDPVTGLPCPPEVLVDRIAGLRATNRLSWLGPLRRLQGWFMAKWRWPR